jgi:8-oxo-dGTP diphosphatase
MTEFPPQPLIAVDVVPVMWTGPGLLVGVAERQFEPYQGRPALPGVLLGAGESLIEAADRALETKAGISPDAVRHRFQIGAFDGPDRDPRQHAIAVVFVAIIDPAVYDTSPDTTTWDLPASGLPFDHDTMVAEAVTQTRQRLWHEDDVTRALTGPWFTTSEAVYLTQDVTGERVHQSNFRRSLANHQKLRSTAAPDTGRPGRQPLGWEWR